MGNRGMDDLIVVVNQLQVSVMRVRWGSVALGQELGQFGPVSSFLVCVFGRHIGTVNGVPELGEVQIASRVLVNE